MTRKKLTADGLSVFHCAVGAGIIIAVCLGGAMVGWGQPALEDDRPASRAVPTVIAFRPAAATANQPDSRTPAATTSSAPERPALRFRVRQPAETVRKPVFQAPTPAAAPTPSKSPAVVVAEKPARGPVYKPVSKVPTPATVPAPKKSQPKSPPTVAAEKPARAPVHKPVTKAPTPAVAPTPPTPPAVLVAEKPVRGPVYKPVSKAPTPATVPARPKPVPAVVVEQPTRVPIRKPVSQIPTPATSPARPKPPPAVAVAEKPVRPPVSIPVSKVPTPTTSPRAPESPPASKVSAPPQVTAAVKPPRKKVETTVSKAPKTATAPRTKKSAPVRLPATVATKPSRKTVETTVSKAAKTSTAPRTEKSAPVRLPATTDRSTAARPVAAAPAAVRQNSQSVRPTRPGVPARTAQLTRRNVFHPPPVSSPDGRWPLGIPVALADQGASNGLAVAAAPEEIEPEPEHRCGVQCDFPPYCRHRGWRAMQPIPWQVFAQGEYVGPHRLPHLPKYRLRVDDEVEFVYRLSGKIAARPYRINIRDTLQIEWLTSPEMNRDVVVQPDGTITLPMAGQVLAAGRTVEDLRADLDKRFAKWFKDPKITVTPTQMDSNVQELRSAVDSRYGSGGQRHRARVTPEGTVQLPAIGSVPAHGLTLDEIKREVDERYGALFDGVEVTPVLLQRAPRFVFVLGEVRQPGRFALEGPTTAIQAIAMAGSWNVGAHLKQVVVFRRDENWRLMATKLDLHGALHGNQPCPDGEIWLRDSDIVIVPKSPILKTDDFINLVFTRGIYGVLPIDAGIGISWASTF